MYNKSKTDTFLREVFNQQTFPTSLITTQNTDMSEEEKLKNQKCFNLFCDTFGSRLVKREVWKYKFLESTDFDLSDCISITDEAFAIFTIERNWNIWQREVDHQEKIKARSGKYTAPNTNVKYRGWTDEGMDRFERLCKDVHHIRKNSKERKSMEQIYKHQKCYILYDHHDTRSIQKPTNNNETEERCCWNELMLDEDDKSVNIDGMYLKKNNHTNVTNNITPIHDMQNSKVHKEENHKQKPKVTNESMGDDASTEHEEYAQAMNKSTALFHDCTEEESDNDDLHQTESESYTVPGDQDSYEDDDDEDVDVDENGNKNEYDGDERSV